MIDAEVLANKTAGAVSWAMGTLGGGRQALMIEVTLSVIIILCTMLTITRIVPYITSAVAFFIKFCLCSAVLSLCMQLVKASALYRAVHAILVAD